MQSSAPGSDLPLLAVTYIDSQDRAPIADPEAPTPRARLMVVLAGIIHHQEHHPDQPIPSLRELPAEWTGYLPDDTHAVQQLHTHRVTSLSDSSPSSAFLIEDGEVLAINPAPARYTLNGGAEHARHVLRLMLYAMCADTPRAQSQREELAALVRDMEVRALISCTEHLRGRPLQEEERGPYAATVRRGLSDGLTVRQFITLIHRAVQETQPPDAALTRWMDSVDTEQVPERAIPEQATVPAALIAGRDLVGELQAAACELHRA